MYDEVRIRYKVKGKRLLECIKNMYLEGEVGVNNECFYFYYEVCLREWTVGVRWGNLKLRTCTYAFTMQYRKYLLGYL